MSNRSGISRGDRNRNARLARLRALVPMTNAIVGIDLADMKQMVVVTDHDSKCWPARRFGVGLGAGCGVRLAATQAATKGWTGVTVACEPTEHRWPRRAPHLAMVLDEPNRYDDPAWLI